MKIFHELEAVTFGLVDGVICLLGLIIGVAIATSNPKIVIIAGIIAGIADAFGNAIGFSLSQSTERGMQIHEYRRHGVKTRIHSKGEVLRSGLFSFLATVLTLIALVIPFFFFAINSSIVISFLIGIILLFLLGLYVGKLSEEIPFKSGFRYACLGIIGAIVCYLIGNLLKGFLSG